MKISLHSKKLLFAFSILLLSFINVTYAQTYNWTGAVDGNFYNASNWTSTTADPVAFDNSAFKFVKTNTVANNAPVINSFVDWQPGVFDNNGGLLTVNANFNFFFNDFLNGTVDVNSGAILTGRNQIRIGRDGVGVVNVNGGLFQVNSTEAWRAILIGVNATGNGTVTISNNGSIFCQNLEVGSRDGYPLGVLNVNSGTATATGGTPIGPNGIINVNGGTLNTGNFLIVGDGYGVVGSINKTPDYGNINLNSGIVIFNQDDLVNPYFAISDGGKFLINNGSLVLKRTGYNYTTDINALVASGKIIAPAGKKIAVSYDGTLKTTVTAVVALPVSLISFTGQTQNNSALLAWSTSSEQNNSHFILSHSADGNNFTLLTMLKASANGNIKNNYSYSHLSPANGNNYYKLEQVDLDGTVKDLGVKNVKFSLSGTQNVMAYPNPTQSDIKVNFEKNIYKTAKLIDLQGKELFKKSISLNDTELTFEMKSFDAGNYLIQLEGKGTYVQKVVKY